MNFLKSKITFGVVFIIYVGLIAVYWEMKGRQDMVKISQSEYQTLFYDYRDNKSTYETASMFYQVLAAVCLIFLVYYFFTYIK